MLVVGLLLYLGLGILSDVLVTGYTLSVDKGWALAASGLSFGITLLSFWILDRVLVIDPSWANVLAYAFGNAIGCYGLMRLSKKVEKEKWAIFTKESRHH